MSNIRFFGLGGLGENGKNMYVCEVDDAIFILDAGIKYPSVDLLGIDAVYPNFEYLEEHKENIQGIFLSHGHEDNIGAVCELLKRFNISVYGTHFTISILEDNLQEEGLIVSAYRLYRINEEKVMKFGDVKVEFYSVNHSIPEAINIAIVTKDGCIVYAPDFSFDVSSDKKYHISFDRINDISKYGVLALASESVGTGNINRTNNHLEFEHLVSSAVMKKRRVFFTLFSTDLDKIQRVINIVVKYNRRIALIGRKTQKIVSIAMERGYLNIPNEKLVTLKFRTEEITNDDKDLVIIVAGIRHEPFYMIQRMCNGQDRLLQINKSDEVIFLSPTIPGTERIAQRTLSQVLSIGTSAYQVTKAQLKSSHASPEHLKMLYAMLKPKYIIPIVGEFRHQYQQRNVAVDAGYKKENVIILENGQVAEFEDDLLSSTSERIECGDILKDGSIIGDINSVVLKDRGNLSEFGIIFVTITVDTSLRIVLGGPDIVSKGFRKDDDWEKEEMKDLVLNYMYRYLNKRNLDLSKASEDLRSKLNDYMYKQTKERPIIIPNIINIK